MNQETGTSRNTDVRYRGMVEAAQSIVWRIDAATGGLNHVSPEAEKLLGYKEEEWYRPNFRQDHVHPDDLLPTKQFTSGVLAGTAKGDIDLRVIAADGRWVWIRCVMRAVELENGRLELVGVSFDQTARHRADAQLTDGVAHDFNNLLTVILGYGELLQPQRIDLNGLLGSLEKMLRRLIRENISITTGLAPNLWPLMADPGQIEQVLINLAVNARDAMPEGGRLDIRTSNLDVDGPNSALPPGMGAGSWLRLSISDTGIGMDEATQRRIFEPFFTAKEKGKGTGLGRDRVRHREAVGRAHRADQRTREGHDLPPLPASSRGPLGGGAHPSDVGPASRRRRAHPARGRRAGPARARGAHAEGHEMPGDHGRQRRRRARGREAESREAGPAHHRPGDARHGRQGAGAAPAPAPAGAPHPLRVRLYGPGLRFRGDPDARGRLPPEAIQHLLARGRRPGVAGKPLSSGARPSAPPGSAPCRNGRGPAPG